jgi:hypothetical protein
MQCPSSFVLKQLFDPMRRRLERVERLLFLVVRRVRLEASINGRFAPILLQKSAAKDGAIGHKQTWPPSQLIFPLMASKRHGPPERLDDPQACRSRR